MIDPTWEELLARFERDLDDATAEFTPWSQPAAPLPAEFADRAGAVLRRQQEQMARTSAQLDDIRHQLDALRRIPSGRSDAPAYLDVNG